mmetsp:Transcript_13983/g.17579  ORF Transcript_13983/g.17579 Transcript_13983/m.17579 type:complete len:124 (-) Transcript_13983:645-1016(-)
MDRAFVNLGVSQDFFNRIQASSEKILAKILEQSSGDGSIKVNSFKQSINFNGSTCTRGKGSLGAFTSSSQSSKGSRIGTEVKSLILSLEFLYEVVHHSRIKIFTSQMSITSSSFYFKDTIINS